MFKKLLYILIFLIIFAIICTIPSVLACRHEHFAMQIISNASCIENGYGNMVCTDCGGIVEENRVISATGHSFGSSHIVEYPSANKNGKEIRTCTVCGMHEYNEVICSHFEVTTEIVQKPTCNADGVESITCIFCSTSWTIPVEKTAHIKGKTVVIKEATCYEEGICGNICVECGEAIELWNTEMIECSYGEAVCIKYPTPFEEGESCSTCSICGRQKYTAEPIITMKDNSLYVPSAGLLCNFIIGEFNQSTIDRNDVVYTEKMYDIDDADNPLILGHWNRSLRPMHKTKVGDYIYVSVYGNIYTYKVMNSEYAAEVDNTYIVGRVTGTNIFDVYSSGFISNGLSFTDRNHNGTDYMPDVNNGKTLHMYTCHYGEDKEEWQSSDGDRGRWIILADLVDFRPLT